MAVISLHREQWNHRGAKFHVEHFVPSSVDPDGECEYSNLLYACATCNLAKQAIADLPNPCEVAFGDCLRLRSDGGIEALNAAGEKLKKVLRLDSQKTVRDRYRWMRVLEVLRATEPGLYNEFMGFPEDLPDLRTKRVPENRKPDGVVNCYCALRERGELPAVY